MKNTTHFNVEDEAGMNENKQKTTATEPRSDPVHIPKF